MESVESYNMNTDRRLQKKNGEVIKKDHQGVANKTKPNFLKVLVKRSWNGLYDFRTVILARNVKDFEQHLTLIS